jgi:FAD/FMN-containing dehydrogenase
MLPQPRWSKWLWMCWPNQVPSMIAVFGLARIIGHISFLGSGANGFFARSSTRQASAAFGSVPPVGSQRSVQRRILAPGLAFSWMTRETFGRWAGALAPPVACVLPHADRAAALTAAIRMARVAWPARSMFIIMPVGRAPAPRGSGRRVTCEAWIMSSLLRDLAGAVGEPYLLTDPGMLAGYTTDWTRRYHGPASCAVRPGSAAEVAKVVRCCAGHGAALVPQGGNTGLVGGSVPPPGPAGQRNGVVVLSSGRLTGLEPVDTLAGQVTAGAGVTISQLRGHAASAGFEYGVDLASRDSATVGGTIATNAGGIHGIRYGPTRAQLLGVAAVLADGRVINRLSGLPAESAGYDLAQLLAGSEGTLGVITAARLRLWPAEPVAAVVLAGAAGVAAAAALQAAIRTAGAVIRAAEYFEAAALDLVRERAQLALPLGRAHAAYLLAEIAGRAEDADRLARAGLPPDAAVALDRSGQAALWAYRERITEAIGATGIPHKMDVAVPVARLAAFRAELDDAVRAVAAGRDWAVIAFGHIGVGNLHVNVLGPDPGDDSVDQAVARLAAAHGGSVSAEHGIGRAKARWLALTRPAAEIAAMRAVKTALDPAGLLNPGVLFPDCEDPEWRTHPTAVTSPTPT